MITRNKAATKTSREKKRKLGEKERETEGISLLESFIQGQIKNNIESLVEGVTRILRLKEIEVNTLKEKVDSLERAKDETDKENVKLKQDLSRAKSCEDCKIRSEKIETLTKCVETMKQDHEKENKKLREHIFTRKMKIKNYISLIKERDDKIEDLDSELAELKEKMEESENSMETEDRPETTKSSETTRKKFDSLEEAEEKEKVRSEPTGKSGENILHMIETTLHSLNSNSGKESSGIDEMKVKKKTQAKAFDSSISNSARPVERNVKKIKKNSKRNRS